MDFSDFTRQINEVIKTSIKENQSKFLERIENLSNTVEILSNTVEELAKKDTKPVISETTKLKQGLSNTFDSFDFSKCNFESISPFSKQKSENGDEYTIVTVNYTDTTTKNIIVVTFKCDYSDLIISTDTSSGCHGDKCRRQIDRTPEYWCNCCFSEEADDINEYVVNNWSHLLSSRIIGICLKMNDL